MPLKAAREIPEEMLSDDTEWGDRSEDWSNYRPSAEGARPRKFRYREPLILCGHGVNIRVDHNTLLVRNGFTHYPQKLEEIRFFPGDANLPDRIIMLDGSGGLTFDALAWMSDQNIEFVRLDWQGEVSAIGGKSGYSANPKLVEIQRNILGSNKRLQIGRKLIAEKVLASISTLVNVFPKSENQEKAIFRLKELRSDILLPQKIKSIPKLLGVEGSAAATYFRVWQGIPLNWEGTGKKPIPSSWREIGPRQMTWRDGTRNARHPINAMLNYGYGILNHRIRKEIVAAGFDPSIGILHGSAQNRIPLVYDLMEPQRPVIDRAILEFALAHTFRPSDFTINNWGGCRVTPQMAKAFVQRIATTNTCLTILSQLT